MPVLKLLIPFVVVAALSCLVTGCNQNSTPETSQPVAEKPAPAAHEEHEHDHEHGEAAEHAAHAKGADDHSGWWCNEHGVPEEVCGQCNAKVAADFQKKNDWCKEHDRPDSQCFVCHPELQARFAAQYEAKYGKQPPSPDAN